ncbi:MAG: hypothetical protein II832_02425 [Synergistaceae bacterium]|nr:hypothetical protein [Synergistaceae bacterium]
MAHKARKSRKRAGRKLIRQICSFLTVLNWLMSFVLTALLLWDRLGR